MTACANACLRERMPNSLYCHPCSAWVAWRSTGRTDMPSPAQTEAEMVKMDKGSKKASKR